jgi:hypothetical protein
VSTLWRGAEIEGRTLWLSEQTLILPLDTRTELQVGWQRFAAKGRVRTNRFSSSARWLAVERVMREEGDRQLVLQVRRLDGSEGTADVAEGLFTYTAPRIDTTSLLSVQRSRGWTTGSRLLYAQVRSGTERAETYGISLEAASTRASHWQVQWQAALYADRHRTTTYRPMLGVGLSYRLAPGARAQVQATVAPRGFPVAGTPIEALTAFTVHRPGGLVESWRERAAGYLTFQITAQTGL